MQARSKAGAGFTIVETMIFLAISGLMFILAISAMGGKQQETTFETSVGTLRSDLNQILSNVADGNYIDQVNGQYVGCSESAGSLSIQTSPTPPTITAGCTAIGETIVFGANSSNQQQYYLVPVFGCNYVNCGVGLNGQNNATDLADANPRIDSNVYQSTILPFGLTIDTANYSVPGAIGVFSFTSFNGNSTGANLGSGSQHVELFAMPNVNYNSASPGNLTPASLVGPINNSGLSDSNCPPGNGYVCSGGANSKQINPPNGLTLCVDSGSDSADKSALFTIGGTNSTTNVSDQVFTKSGCAP